jgi:N-methylhydantoinase A
VVARGAPGQPLIEQRTAFARYVGQGYEIPVTLPARLLQGSDAPVLRKAFEHSYREQYGRPIDGIDIEILAWTVTVGTEPVQASAIAPVGKQPTPPVPGRRDVFDVGEGGWIEAAVYRRCELTPGSTLSGPAIIAEESTSTLIASDYDAAIAADTSIVMTRRSAK